MFIYFFSSRFIERKKANTLIYWLRISDFFAFFLRGFFLSFRDIYFILNISAIIIISSISFSHQSSLSLFLLCSLITWEEKLIFSYVRLKNWETDDSLNWASLSLHCISTPRKYLIWLLISFHQTLLSSWKLNNFPAACVIKKIFFSIFLIISIDLID